MPAAQRHIETLTTAITETDEVRHGHARARYPTDDEVAALIHLDRHPALRRISESRRDDDWVRDVAADRAEQQRAAAYLEYLDDDDEADRRAAAAQEAQPGYVDLNPVEVCPVCGYDALVTTGSDSYGYAVGAGYCYVCSYLRSHEAADIEGWTYAMQRALDKND